MPAPSACSIGNGDGTFQAPVTHRRRAEDATRRRSADLTGDGNLDVITTSVLKNTVTVQLGNGDGTFGPGADHGGRSGADGRGRGRLERRRPARPRHGQLRRQHGERAPGQRRRHLQRAADLRRRRQPARRRRRRPDRRRHPRPGRRQLQRRHRQRAPRQGGRHLPAAGGLPGRGQALFAGAWPT